MYGSFAKLFMDGSLFSQLFRSKYDDGHQGVWMTSPKVDRQGIAELFWTHDVPIWIHVNGDEALSEVLDIYDGLWRKSPKPSYMVVLQHIGVAGPDDALIKRMAAMRRYPIDIRVNLLPYYLYAVGRRFVDNLGRDKAERITAAGDYVKNGIPVALHSDFGMAPADPLFLAWIAVNRMSIDPSDPNGALQPLYEPGRLTIPQAIRAVTIEAALTLRETPTVSPQPDGGRIEVGNTADFVVLETSWDGLRQMLGRGERFDGVRVSYTVKAGKRTEQ